MDILVVNINGLSYTKDLVDSLLSQDKPYLLTVVDQASVEEGTKEYLVGLSRDYKYIRVQFNEENVPLSTLWNNHYLSSGSDIVCFLNNDLLISPNFVSDTESIFKKEKMVGCVIHATNHPQYKCYGSLRYTILTKPVTQGWDFAIRRAAYNLIPDEIKFYGGDDFLFNKLKENKWEVAMALSSPVIHFKAKSRRYYPGDRTEESKVVADMGVERFSYQSPYTKPYPKFLELREE